MSHIKNKNTSIELLVRRRLFAMGYRYRVNYKALPGKPDIVGFPGIDTKTALRFGRLFLY